VFVMVTISLTVEIESQEDLQHLLYSLRIEFLLREQTRVFEFYDLVEGKYRTGPKIAPVKRTRSTKTFTRRANKRLKALPGVLRGPSRERAQTQWHNNYVKHASPNSTAYEGTTWNVRHGFFKPISLNPYLLKARFGRFRSRLDSRYGS
jgi:hypothetical protein